MKNKSIIILSVLFLLCFFNVSYAESNNTITINSIYNDENGITASGSVSSGKTQEITILVLDANEEISYIDQKKSNTDGSFEFRFNMKNPEQYGQYTIKIGGEKVNNPASVIYDYQEPIQLVKQKFLAGNLNISINNFIPGITGTLECFEGRQAEMTVTNVTDNTVIANYVIEEENGVVQISLALPSLIYTKDYRITVTSRNGDENLLLADLTISSSALSAGMTGNVTVGGNVNVEGNIKSVNNNLIDTDVTFTGSKSIDYTLPKLMAYGSYNLSFSCYEEVVFIPEEDRNEAITKEYSYQLAQNDELDLYINLQNVDDLHNKLITVSFDNSELQLIDGCLFTESNELSAGTIPGTDTEIISVSENSIVFSINNYIDIKKAISGSISGISFKALQNIETVVTVNIREKEGLAE